MSRWSLISTIGSVVDLLCCTVVEWSWDHWWVVAKPENCHRAYCHLIDSHRHRSIHTRVVHGRGARGRDFSMSSGSTESQYGLRHVNGVPVWNRDMLILRHDETAVLWFRAGLKPGEQERAVARLWANLQGPAKEVVRMCKPQDFEDARGVERLLRILRASPLASMPVPDAHMKIQTYDQIRRRLGEVIGDYIWDSSVFSAIWQKPSDVSETPETRKLEHDFAVLNSDAGYEMVEDEDIFTEALSTFFEFEIGGYRLLQNASLSREERQMVLDGTRNDTEHTAIVTQLRSAWDDQDLRDRDRGSKSFGKGGTVHFAEVDTEWYAEQIAHSISGDAADLDVTWSFDPDEAIWCCGVLDPSIREPDVVDWSEDLSNYESSPCAEDVFPEQSQALAQISEDVLSPECVQHAEVLAAEANRTFAQARSAVASEEQNRSGFFPPSTCLPVARARTSSRENQKIHLVSFVAEAIIFGTTVTRIWQRR